MTLAAKAIPRVLSRHNLLMGCEREPILVAALVAGAVAIPAFNLIGIASGAGLWVASLVILRWAAKADPLMLGVYIRSLKYAGFYPAGTRPYAEAKGTFLGFVRSIARSMRGGE